MINGTLGAVHLGGNRMVIIETNAQDLAEQLGAFDRNNLIVPVGLI